MTGFSLGLLDNLTGSSTEGATDSPLQRLSLDELKDAVARDLEALLNTRCVMQDESLRPWPECARSILAYGIRDFAGLSLANTDDRTKICQSIENGIAKHEPRLRNVRTALEEKAGAINKLHFSIAAILVVSSTSEPVSFDAVLQPSTLRYSINRTRRIPHR